MNLLKKKKILFISNNTNQETVGGRKNLTLLNKKVLKNIFGKNFFSFEIKKKKIKSTRDILLAITGNIDGINNEVLIKIKDLIEKKKINYLYIDGSNLGKIARKINNKNTKIVTFCHNVETEFFLKKFKYLLNFRNFYILLANFFAEFQSVIYSDYMIFLNNRDKLRMRNFFFKKNSFIVPMSVEDRFNKIKNRINKNKYIIFVGSNFFGNTSGLDWYIENVAKYINFDTYVIGKNLSKKKYKIYKNIKFMGYVKNLGKFYKRALFSVAPIFQGSGMKTKIAESLMFGKHVVGLNEAFVGYEKFQKQIGFNCKDANSFIKAINFLGEKKLFYCESKLRKIYLRNYSVYSMKNLYKKIFDRI